MKKLTRFKRVTACAARQERKGDFKAAAEWWVVAEKEAKQRQNKEWCAARIEFCRSRWATYSMRLSRKGGGR